MDVKMADRLMELRKRHGLSQEELADKLNISRQAVSKWERAESAPDTDNLIALSRLYGTSIDEMLNGNKAEGVSAGVGNECYAHIIAIPINRKKALKIVSFVFLGLGILFILMGTGFFLGFSLPETIDLKLAQNESIAPVNAEVTYKIRTSISEASETQYRVVFVWKEGNTEKTGQSNPAYSESEADALVGKTVLVRVDGGRAVLVNYQKSALSLVGFIFIGVFGGLGILFTGAFILIYFLNKKEKSKS